MAGWCRSGSESDDDEPLNLALFARKSFGFRGFPSEQDNRLRKIVQQLGATCDYNPKYMFTTKQYFESVNTTTPMYNVSYIRDCVDANRCVNIDQYRFGLKLKCHEYRDFEPCCNNFHRGKKACPICTNYKQIPAIKYTKKTNHKTSADTGFISPKKKKYNYGSSWTQHETYQILNYIIANKLYIHIKSPSLFKRMEREMVTKRSSESMRVHFRKQVLPNIENFDLPPSAIKKFKQIRSMPYPRRQHLQELKNKFVKQKNDKFNNVET